ncbi:ATP-binding protein [Paenibacillus sp. KACC 21273]|uniref:ATP-binding protein n=1 Tax=Paenibacillus sp. KACC 21273 TaxID=3025665 RepID=UPI0023660A60|nr:ATP-binding protein [Paenibacillus sp. KACC 21273]WDF50545.1 ATP-binding protein [Paenibacillus sp. KACC 21273]
MNPARGGLARRVALWTIVLFLVFGIIIFAVEWFFKQQTADITNDINTHLNQQNQIQDMDEDYRTAVSDFRAYLAYDRNEFLLEAETSRDQFVKRLDTFKKAQTEDSRLDELSRKSTEYFSYFPVMQALKQQNNQTEINRISQTITTSLVQSVNSELDRLMQIERQEVNDLIAKSKRINSLILFVPLVLILLGLGTAVILIRYLRKSIIHPIAQMEQAVERISKGEYIHLENTFSQDEIGGLVAGINHMSDQLKERHQELEESLRQMGEQHDELEAQNEEIMMQQQEQETILERLTERETQLQWINSYQEKLTGFAQMNDFLESSLRALMQATRHDALMLVIQDEIGNPASSRMMYSIGWPHTIHGEAIDHLFGPALQVLEEKSPIVRSRTLSTEEKGVHQGYERADDHYYPIFNEEMNVLGFVLFTTYGSLMVHIKDKLMTEGLIGQFGLAYQAQLASEERRKQSVRLEELNTELELEKRMLKQQRDTIQQIIDSLHEGLVLCDPQGTISFCNQQVSRVNPELITGANITSLTEYLDHHTVEHTMLSEQIQQLLTEESKEWKTQFSLQGRDGSIYYMEMYMNMIKGMNLENYHLFVFRDRTEEEQADQLKNEFVSIVSHELRTPLASILGFVEILLHREVKPEKAKKYMETIHGEANRLSNLISDFLDLQRMESGKQNYTLVPFDLNPIVQSVAKQWDNKQGYTIGIDVPEGVCLVRADSDRITQVMHNLISNAIKYSPGQERVDVRLVDGDTHWIAAVQDYGLGIPEESKPHMFGKFYRVDNSDRRQIGGTGLGLAIVKEIVEDLGGEVYFDSILGQGSTFYIKLPKFHLRALDDKIVVLEDDENLARLIGATFEEQNYEILRMDTAEEALLALEYSQQPPLLCLVDVQLHGSQNGWDFIQALKNDKAYRHVPVIISSALDQPDNYAETSNERYLQKPFSVERLLELGMNLIHSDTKSTGLVVAMQNEDTVKTTLQKNGLGEAELQLNEDFIQVDWIKEDTPPQE